ncbi:MAG: translocation/assembly module TamB domain-containing protein [Bacteroidetes bacterium]|nr:translocation/assembly module TamB domain-containing protein [Bacteroidota bacterium]
MSRFALIILFAVLFTKPVSGQDDLSLSNAETTVRGITFRFPETATFDAERLKLQMATKAPGFFDNWKRRLDFLPFVSPKMFAFDPIELQRDVVRLRNYFHRSGFPRAKIDYPASQFRLADNSILVIMTIMEGVPLTMDSVSVQLQQPIYDGLLVRWNRLLSSIESRAGQRFTDLQQLSMENELVGLLQDRGYAFASVLSEVSPGVNENTVVVAVKIDPGPLTTFDHILIEGSKRLEERLLLRELPFKSGDRYSRKKPKEDPEVFGSISILPERSRIIQFGKRFELDRGELTFNGPMKAPRLNLEASYTIPSRGSETEEVTIRLIANGSPENLDVSFDSEPSMELADIFSYIATGRPAAASLQISGAQSDSYLESAAGLALGPVTDLIENLAGAGLGLDVIEIEHTGFSGLTLTAGKYVSPKLYVSVSQPISLSSSAEANNATNKNQTQVTMEYELFRQLLMNLVNRGTILRVNLRWQLAF